MDRVFLPSDLAGYTYTMRAEQNVSWKAQSVERFTVEREVVGLFLLFPRAGPILCRVYGWEMKALPPETATALCGSDDHVKWRSCLLGYRPGLPIVSTQV